MLGPARAQSLSFAVGRAPAAAARPQWKARIDHLTRGLNIGVSVAFNGDFIYGHAGKVRRRPASNQKLLLSMALLDAFGPRARVPTYARARNVSGGVVSGRLWIAGRGDPSAVGAGPFARSLGIRPTYVGRLARRIAAAGIHRIKGRVMGSTGYFLRDWDAPGWLSHYQSLYIALPTALALNGNTARGRHILDPERRFAAALTDRLEKLGVRVDGAPGAGPAPQGLSPVAAVRSAPLKKLMRHMNRRSSNFFAEMLGKRLAAERYGPPGSIAAGARAIAAWARGNGVTIESHDSSGLSHANHVSARGITRLLEVAGNSPWGEALRRSLPGGGQGTLEDRLGSVALRAKTGTLENVSALSGWIWLQRRDHWAQFSILSSGTSKEHAVEVENAIVRTLSLSAR